jgi:hypothetical protein
MLLRAQDLQRKEAEGKSRMEAMRCLKRQPRLTVNVRVRVALMAPSVFAWAWRR